MSGIYLALVVATATVTTVSATRGARAALAHPSQVVADSCPAAGRTSPRSRLPAGGGSCAGRPGASAKPRRSGEARHAARALGRRHRILQAILVPTAHRLMGYRTLHYELIPG